MGVGFVCNARAAKAGTLVSSTPAAVGGDRKTIRSGNRDREVMVFRVYTSAQRAGVIRESKVLSRKPCDFHSKLLALPVALIEQSALAEIRNLGCCRSYRDVARRHYSRIIVSGEVNQPDSFARSWSHSQPFLRAEQEAEAPSNQGGKRARARTERHG